MLPGAVHACFMRPVHVLDNGLEGVLVATAAAETCAACAACMHGKPCCSSTMACMHIIGLCCCDMHVGHTMTLLCHTITLRKVCTCSVAQQKRGRQPGNRQAKWGEAQQRHKAPLDTYRRSSCQQHGRPQALLMRDPALPCRALASYCPPVSSCGGACLSP
jgi:hypothetical protein